MSRGDPTARYTRTAQALHLRHGYSPALVDDGRIRTTDTERLSPIDAVNLKRAHALVESGTARGKVVLEGWRAGHEYSR